MANKEINIVIKAVDEATKTLQGIGGELSGFAKNNEATFTKMSVAGGVAFAAIAAGANEAIQAFAESEEQLARVDAALRNIDLGSMGSSFDEAAAKAREFGDGLQNLAGISGEAGSESFAKLLQVTNDYEEATKLATLAADLSVAKQIDLSSATRIVSSAMAGNTRILKEYGIELDEGASKQEVIGVLMDRVGGQAQAFGATINGQNAILSESFGDLKETVGSSLAPMFTGLIQTVTPVIQSFTQWASNNSEFVGILIIVAGALSGIVTVVGLIGLAIPSIITGFGAVATALTFLTGPIGLIVLAISALTLAWTTNFMGIRDMTAGIITQITEIFSLFFENLLLFWATHGENVMLVVTTLFEGLVFIIQTAFDYLSVVFKTFFDLISVVVNVFSGNWSKAWELIKGIVVTNATFIGNTLKSIFGDTRKSITDGLQVMYDFILSKFETLLGFITGTVDKLKGAWSSAVSFFGGGGDSPAGARAVGGPVQGGKSYLVGERGPEMFTPATSGSITPNSQMSGGGASININMGGVTVTNEADEQRLAQTIIQEITRQTQLFNLGIN